MALLTSYIRIAAFSALIVFVGAPPAIAQEEKPIDPFLVDSFDTPSLPVTPEDLSEPVTIEEMQEQARREALLQSGGRSAGSGINDLGQRLEPTDTAAINPIDRINNRIENRIRNRLQTRVDRDANSDTDATRAIERANRRSRDTSSGPRR